MRTFIAAIVILAVLVGFGTYAYKYIEKTANSLVTKTELVQKNAINRNWKQTEKSFNALRSSWDNSSKKWTMLIDHQELDNINISLSRARQYLDTRYEPGLLAELAELKLLLQHIPQKEAINIDNMI